VTRNDYTGKAAIDPIVCNAAAIAAGHEVQRVEKMQVDIGDAELAVEIEGEGQPVLLIAGLGGRLAFWRRQRSVFAEHYRVILHDHRGTGASTRSEIDYSVEQMSRDVLALMDALGVDRAHLVGHSTGGAICQTIALEYPERADKIVLSATWPGTDPWFDALFALRLQVLEQCGARAYLMDGTLRALPAAWLQQRGDQLEQMVDDRLAEFPGKKIEASRIAAIRAFDAGRNAEKIRHQPLVICAEDDQITPSSFSRELAGRIPDARLKVLATGGHFVPQVCADEYNRKLLNFLRNPAAGR
jgi:aminoacrylate hydrolase